MPDNSQEGHMPTFSPGEGLDSLRDALTKVQSQNQAIVCYHEGDDPTVADPDWIAEHQADNSFPPAAAVLIPVDAWNEYANLRNQNTGVDAAETALRLRQGEQQIEQVALQPRIEAVKLALETVTPHANSRNTYTAALLKNANEIHTFLTTGTVPEGAVSQGEQANG